MMSNFKMKELSEEQMQEFFTAKIQSLATLGVRYISQFQSTDHFLEQLRGGDLEFTSFAQCFKLDVQVDGEPDIQDLLTHFMLSAFFDMVTAHRKDKKLPFAIKVLQRLCQLNTNEQDFASTLRLIEIVGFLRMNGIFVGNSIMPLLNPDNRCATNSYLFAMLSYFAACDNEIFDSTKYLPVLRAIGQEVYETA